MSSPESPKPVGRGHHNKGTIQEEFLRRVAKQDGDSCWLWTGATFEGRYGRMMYQSVLYSAHRLSWLIHSGEVPIGFFVCHKCDTGLCVRPDHLFLGTHEDNMKDMATKGRSLAGTRNPRAKLTEQQVREIRASALSNAALSRLYNISDSSIEFIKAGVTWRNVV